MSTPALHRILYDWSPQVVCVLSGYGTELEPQLGHCLAENAHRTTDNSRAAANKSWLDSFGSMKMKALINEYCENTYIYVYIYKA